jgi:hypothetical protein
LMIFSFCSRDERTLSCDRAAIVAVSALRVLSVFFDWTPVLAKVGGGIFRLVDLGLMTFFCGPRVLLEVRDGLLT